MYPNLYYVFKDWFGVEWKALAVANTFGLMVAMGFLVAAVVLSSELKRKEKFGWLFPREETIMVGQPASVADLLINFITGFAFAYKFAGLLINKPEEMSPQDYIFSAEGSLWAGLLAGAAMAALKWWERNKQKLKEPEQRIVRIWPHDRVGDIIIIGLIFGILGAKLFDNLENWDEFIKDPMGRIFSAGGLTFYGGLIMAAIAICYYGYRKGIKIIHLVDAAAPALMIAYAVGRIGCQVAGDGDWGIYNSAYINNPVGKVVLAGPDDFQKQLDTYQAYFLLGKVQDTAGGPLQTVTDRTYRSLEAVPRKAIKAPSFIPVWMVAYNYPQNVNSDGVILKGNRDDHNRVLPLPVFPTPFYETVLCTLLFLFLWTIRKKIKIPGIMFGIYLILNGMERFVIEKIRVNNHFSVLGFRMSQAEIIALLLIISGGILVAFCRSKNAPSDKQ